MLIESTISPGITGGELAEMLYVSPLAVSRAAARLEQRRLLAKRAERLDLRRKGFAVTAHGKKMLAEIDREANQVLDDMSGSLSSDEVRALETLLNQVAEAFPLGAAAGRPVDHRLRPAIRTLTRGFGHLADTVFGVSEVSTFEWHVLSAIAESAGDLQAGGLAERFGSKSSSLSVLLTRLEKSGIIRRKAAASGDKRAKTLALSAKGSELLSRIASSAHAVLSDVTKGLSSGELQRLAILMKNLVRNREVRVSLDLVLKERTTELKKGVVDIFFGGELLGTVASPFIPTVDIRRFIIEHIQVR